MATLKPLERPTLLHHSVQDAIKDFILDNDLHVGDALPSELELSQTLSVSRNSVREGVKVLEAQGYVEIRRGTGLFVGKFSFGSILDSLQYNLLFDLSELVHLTQVRQILERGLIEIVVEEMTDTQLDRLKALLEQMRLKTERNENYIDEDRAFHRLISEPLENPILLKVVEMFWLTYTKASEKYGDISHPEGSRIYQNHVDIVTALEAKNIEAARKAVDTHYEVAESYITHVHNRVKSDT